MSTYTGQSALVLGLGESGLAMARWLSREGALATVADTRDTPPAAAELRRSVPGARIVTGNFDDSLLDGMDLVALSPGLSRREAIVRRAEDTGIPVLGEIELFARGLVSSGLRRDAHIIAITGTNGKTTVTSMVGAMARAAGFDTAVAGNISPSALSELMDCLDRSRKPAVWALELSSFQLESVDSLDADAATVLNVSDDHLDRYDGLADYAAAKSAIFAGRGIQVLNRADSRVVAMARPGRDQVSFGLDAPPSARDFGVLHQHGEAWLAEGTSPLLPAGDLQLAGQHNLANSLAALALTRSVGIPAAGLLAGLRQFRGLPHRVEYVAEVGGVTFYDDSKGTNVGATVAAVSGLGCKVALILGGDGKGQDFSLLAPAVAAHARAVVLIGRDADLIDAAIRGCDVPLARARTLQAATVAAFAAAQPGDAVLLSPACASWDMFNGYAERARVFVESVAALAAGRKS